MSGQNVSFAPNTSCTAGPSRPANQVSQTTPWEPRAARNDVQVPQTQAPGNGMASASDSTVQVKRLRGGFSWPFKEFIPGQAFVPIGAIPEHTQEPEHTLQPEHPPQPEFSSSAVLQDDSPESDEETDQKHPTYPFADIASNYTLLDQINLAAYEGLATKPAMDKHGRLREYFFEPKWGQTGIVAPSRHMKARVPKDLPVGELKMIFEEYGELNGLYASKHQTDGVLYMSFFDLRASLACHHKLQERYGLKFCARSILENGQDAVYPVVQEATIIIDVVRNNGKSKNGEAQVLTDILQKIGPILSITSPGFTTNSPKYTVEFADVRDAKVATELYRDHLDSGMRIKCRYVDIEHHRWVVADQMIEITESENLCRVSSGSTQLISDQLREERRRELAERDGGQTGGNGFHRGNGPTTRHMQLVRLNRGRDRDHCPNDKSNFNYVDVAAIKAGRDPRTTIMIRNIPNRLGQDTILAWLDETSFRRYDFCYLRIDFSNGCNMGYCFVNFLTTKDVVNFFKERVGASWTHYQSDKRVGVLYADMQGKPTLIARFRNSSVMDQVRSCRPLAFHSDGPDAGLEMTFPPPDNLGQKLRSVTSAAANGLYRRGRGGRMYFGGRRFSGNHHNHHNGGRGPNGGWQNHHQNGQRAINGNWQNQANGPRGLVNGNMDIPPCPVHTPYAAVQTPQVANQTPYIPSELPLLAPYSPSIAQPSSPLPVINTVPVDRIPPLPDWNVPRYMPEPYCFFGPGTLEDYMHKASPPPPSPPPQKLTLATPMPWLPSLFRENVIDPVTHKIYPRNPSTKTALQVTKEGSPVYTPSRKSKVLTGQDILETTDIDDLYAVYPLFKADLESYGIPVSSVATPSVASTYPRTPTSRSVQKTKPVHKDLDRLLPTAEKRDTFIDWLLAKCKEQYHGERSLFPKTSAKATPVPATATKKVAASGITDGNKNTPGKLTPRQQYLTGQGPAYMPTPKGQFRSRFLSTPHPAKGL
ncbi:hypothetical protein ABW21_db0209655 [Orbilia brochopaga]|nr:hypothetical protein ABW21_db0209655 [Drechslerella brochopaga]